MQISPQVRRQSEARVNWFDRRTGLKRCELAQSAIARLDELCNGVR